MKLSRFYWLGVCTALFGLLVFSYARSTRNLFAEYGQIEQTLARLKQLDTTLNEDVLKIRFHLIEDYDGFLSNINQSKQAVSCLDVVPPFVTDINRSIISERAKALSALLIEKEQMIEDFKTQNAILNNSLRYLPVAGSELIKKVSSQEETRSMERPLNLLMQRVLLYTTCPNEDGLRDIEDSLNEINGLLAFDPSIKSMLAGINAHVNSIIHRLPRVEMQMRNLVSLPVGTQAEELAVVLKGQFSQALHRADENRQLLLTTCGILILGIGFTFFALQKANRNLETRVAERTNELLKANDQLLAEMEERKQAGAKLELLNKELLEVSRLAGMAEIATGILHNVGNVLNSVNVTSTCLVQHISKSKVSSLDRAVALMRENRKNLFEFLTEDPKGMNMTSYLDQLAARLSLEQAKSLSELAILQKHIEHINVIVTMQQTFATGSSITEVVRVTDVIEDALRIHEAGLNRQQVRVEKEFCDIPSMTIAKHKLLQILVNLLRNAKHACLESDQDQSRVEIKVIRGDESCRITVSDNGVGIAAENLTRIFSHGFSTKKTGHGFGLHSSALFAKELGGALHAQSNGPGHGATFTLVLPLNPGENN